MDDLPTPAPSGPEYIVQLRGISRMTPGRLMGILDLIDGPTRRRIRCGQAHHEVKSWMLRHALGQLDPQDPGLSRFRAELKSAPTVSDSLVCYRGRTFLMPTLPPGSHSMGPPPEAGMAEPQRYNFGGSIVLHLSDSEVGVRQELRDRIKIAPGTALFVQRFVLPVTNVRIADFSQVDPASAIASTCWFAEHATEGKVLDDVPTWAFSQMIAAMAAEHFDGIRVPGVRGTNEENYTNIVMFRTEPWRDWVDTACSPYDLPID